MRAPVARIQRRRPSSTPRSSVYAATAHQQDQQGVGVVEAEHQRRDRGEGERDAREERGAGREVTAHGGEHDADRRDAHQRLRGQHTPAAEPEDPDRQATRPQRGGGLVDRDRVGCIRRAEEPGGPVLRTGLGRGGVERVAPSRRAQVPQVERGGRQEQPRQRRSFPPARAVWVSDGDVSDEAAPAIALLCAGSRSSAGRAGGLAGHPAIGGPVGASSTVSGACWAVEDTAQSLHDAAATPLAIQV